MAKTTRQTAGTNIIAPEGRCVIAIGPFCWGKGADSKTALRKARENFSPTYIQPGRVTVHLYDADAGAYVDGMGAICYPGDKEKTRKVGEATWIVARR